MNILDKIVEKTKIRVKNLYETVNTIEYKNSAYDVCGKKYRFENALRNNKMSFICEIKKASPSKGIISEDFPYLTVAREYEKANADAISVLTEPDFFLGDINYLKEIAQTVNIPVLRKDFIIDEIQIYESKLINADAILLICSILDYEKLKTFIKIAESLGLSCLTEAHDKFEIETALKAGAKIIGVNNRDLKTFNINIQNSINLRKFVPDDILFVSESGIESRNQIEELEKNSVNAVLIGETLMKSPDKKHQIQILKGEVK